MAKKKESQLKHITFKTTDIEIIEKAAKSIGATFSMFIRLAALEKAKKIK